MLFPVNAFIVMPHHFKHDPIILYEYKKSNLYPV